MPTPTFILSLDTEIAWGTYANLSARAAAFDAYPSLLRRLVRQLSIYEISATWAVVGALFGDPSQVPQPHYSFATAPDATRARQHPAAWFHLPAVLDIIQAARTPQEIGTHTYTHLLATDPGVTRELFARQLAAVVGLHRRHGLTPPRSLVYPQNRIAYTDLLREHGITAYRGSQPSWYGWLPKALQRPAHLLSRANASLPPVYRPVRASDGLVNLPASQFLMSYDGVRRRVPTAARVRQAERGLARAIRQQAVFHLWFHPFNLGSDDAMFDALQQILTLVWEHRAAGRLQVRTMGAVAAEVLAQPEKR